MMRDETPRERQVGWAVVHCAQVEWQAEMARAILIEEGIPAVIRSYLVTPYAGALLARGPCAAEVMVPNTCREAAESLLAAMLSEGGSAPPEG